MEFTYTFLQQLISTENIYKILLFKNQKVNIRTINRLSELNCDLQTKDLEEYEIISEEKFNEITNHIKEDYNLDMLQNEHTIKLENLRIDINIFHISINKFIP